MRKRAFEKAAASAAPAAVKARQGAIQLWGRGRLTILNLPRFCRTCRICPHRDRFRDELDVRSVLATVRLLFSVLSIREPMYNYIDALMFLSRSNVEPLLSQIGRQRVSPPYRRAVQALSLKGEGIFAVASNTY